MEHIQKQTCLVCHQYWCVCSVTWSPEKIYRSSTDILREVYLQMTGRSRWPDGREDEAARAIADELTHRSMYHVPEDLAAIRLKRTLKLYQNSR